MENKKFEFKVSIHLIGNAWERIQIYKYVYFEDAHKQWQIAYNEHRNDFLKGRIKFNECFIYISNSDSEILNSRIITKK